MSPIASPHDSAKSLGQTQRVLNVPFLVISLLIFATVGVAAHFVRNWQVARTATVFVSRADAAEADGKWLESAEYLSRYLQLAADDQAARIRLARTFKQGIPANSQKSRHLYQRAISLYFRAIGAGVKEEELPLRQDVGMLLVSCGQFLEAEQEAAKILALAPDDQIGLRLRAISLARQYGKGSFAREKLGEIGIVAALRKANQASPGDVELAELLALALRDKTISAAELPDVSDERRLVEATACIDRLVQASPNDVRAFLSRYAYRMKYGLAGADEDLAQAERIEPNSVIVLLAAAQAAQSEATRVRRAGGTAAHAEPYWKRARDLYQKVVGHKFAEIEPAPLLALGEAQLQLNDVDAAIATWTAGLAKFPQSAVLFRAPLAATFLDLNKLSEAGSVLDAIDREIGQLPPSTAKESRLQLQRDQDLRRGLWHVKNRQPQQAIPHLRQVILRQEQLGIENEQTAKAWLLLGGAFAANGEWVESATAYDRASGQQPKLGVAKLGAATSWLAANRAYLAVERAEKALELGPNARAFYTLASALFQQQSAYQGQDQLWTRLEKSLDEAEARAEDKTLEEPWRIELLRADSLVAKAKATDSPEVGRAQALEVLRAAGVKYPNVKDFWKTLAIVYQILGQSKDADRACDHLAAQSAEDGVIIRARVFTMRGEHDRADELLMQSLSKVVAPMAAQREMINVRMSRRDFSGARTLLLAIIEKNPGDLGCLRMISDIDLNARELRDLQRWETAMEASGGTGPTLARYYRVRRLMAEAKTNNDPQLAEAANEVAILHHLRSNSSEVASLKGLVEQRLGRFDSAILAFEQAIDLGEQRVGIFEQLIALLERRNRSADAEKYLSRLKAHVPFSHDLTAFESTVEIRKNQPEHAVEVARRGVERRPKDPTAYIWLGRMLLVNNQREPAEAAFKRAVELEPENVRSWNGLFSFYVHQGDKEVARKTLKDLSKQAKLGDAERSFVLAQGYELLGDATAAADEYRKASALAPQNTAILLRISGFYLRTDPEESQRSLRKVLRIDPQSSIARRTLAAILAARGTEADWSEVRQLLVDFKNDQASSLDNRLSAILLIQRGGAENYQKAVTILEELISRPEGHVPSDRLMLSQLYEKQARIAIDPEEEKRRLENAREQFINLCARSAAQPAHLISYIEFLVRHNQKREAARWLQKLGDIQTSTKPSSALLAEQVRLALLLDDVAQAEKWQASLEVAEKDTLAIVSLRAQLMKRQGKLGEIDVFVNSAGERLLEKAQDDQQQIIVMVNIGTIAGSVEALPLAETWYRKLYEKSPESFEPLARVLAEQGRLSEAMNISFQAAEKGVTSKPAITLSRMLISFKPPPADVKRAEQLLASAAKKFDKDSQLLFSLASLRVLQERIDEAAELFRQVVALNPRHVVALNNLATLLSESPAKRKEALKYIDKAIEITGTEAALFDTKGTILLFDGQSDKAVEFLRAAVDSQEADPRYRFHLALAYHDLKNVELARNELEKALEQDLEKQILTPTEQKLLTELRSALTP